MFRVLFFLCLLWCVAVAVADGWMVYPDGRVVDFEKPASSLKGGGPSFVTVGSTNDCDFRQGAKIQDALDLLRPI